MLKTPDLPAPWASFLGELDALLDEAIQLHYIGGFAVVAGYGLPRATNDLDYRTVITYGRINDGPRSTLAPKYKVHAQHPGVDAIPESYDERLCELSPGRFKNIRLFIPEAYDLVLSKLRRNIERLRTAKLRSILIGDPKQHDKPLEFWIEACFARSQS
jgi:hypothetical protein